jgi:tetratricopeptide (TPR) repeat protein
MPKPASSSTATLDDKEAPRAPPPASSSLRFLRLDHLGPYRIEAKLASGGMGVVYRASREHPTRSAALKLMSRALGNADAVRRFEYESQVLAMLEHPNIAHVYDSGTLTVAGELIPWYAMELIVGGRSLREYIGDEPTPLEERLDIFLQACEGVQHAHQKGVIHRDLKPANIMLDAEKRVKIIDFGIAKAVGQDAEDSGVVTIAGERLGTPAYMSPEQALGESHMIDVRTDVYALGVILYNLCTQRMPYVVPKGNYLEAVKAICNATPDIQPLDEAKVPTDLRLIVFKALSKEPERRYESVSALMVDVRSFVAGAPISARATSVWYLVQRFAARNKAMAFAAISIAVTLVAGMALSTTAYMAAEEARSAAELDRDRAREERERALKAQKDALWARDFASELMFAADPWQGVDSELGVEQLLDRASRRLETHPDGLPPAVELDTRRTLAEVYGHLGRVEAARLEAERVVALAEANPDLADEYPRALTLLMRCLVDDGKIEEAASRLDPLLALHQEHYGEKDPRTWDAQSVQAMILEQQGKLKLAMDINREVLERRRAHFGAESEESLGSMSMLAGNLFAFGELTDAQELYQDVYSLRTKVSGEDHPATLIARGEVLGVVVQRGELEGAGAGQR